MKGRELRDGNQGPGTEKLEKNMEEREVKEERV